MKSIILAGGSGSRLWPLSREECLKQLLLLEKDENGNVLTGSVVVDNVKNSFIYSQKEVVAVSSLENIILVETEDDIIRYEDCYGRV